RRGRDVVAVLVLDRGEGQPGGLGVGIVDVPDGPWGGLYDLRHSAVTVASVRAGGPVNGRAGAKLPGTGRGQREEQGEVRGRTRGVGADGEGDRGVGQVDTRVDRLERRVVPVLDLALEDVPDGRRVQLQAADPGQVVRHRDRAEHDREVQHGLALEVRHLVGGDRRVRAGVVDDARGQVRTSLARAAA